MVDSSVGGKTAVDHPLGKNLIGAFHQPKRVFVDSSFLETLSEREFRAGYAELFKCAFIGGREMFDFVIDNHRSIIVRTMPAVLEGVRRSVAIKANVVEQDEFETSGLRALLNFGHTFAHALERYFNFGNILHGEAVWWGMRCAIDCARRSGTLGCESDSAYEKIEALLHTPKLPSKPDPQQCYDMMFTDKKVVDGKLRLVLPTVPGTSVVRNDVPAGIVKETWTAVFR
jgi:3-dehydroquinate synthase